MELSVDTMVNENVRLIRPLGQGAMGEVWVAQHLTLRTEVAVKFITPELGNKHQDILTRFEQEAAMAAQIKSPYVVQTFDQGKMSDGTPFIVMELLEGESLQEHIDRVGPLQPSFAVAVVGQMARALGKAHRLGIVHRDIKPDNVFVSNGDDGLFCKILDFGIAKQTRLPQVGGLTHAGIMIGTPEYMSPEQVMSSKDVDAQADVWAVAVTAYQMLTGELPFEGEAIGDLCVKLLEGRYAPATQVRSELPVALDAFFEKAFCRDVEGRFDSARDLARALRQVFPLAQVDASLFDSLDTAQPPKVALLPRHRAATAPGSVSAASLLEDSSPGAQLRSERVAEADAPPTERDPHPFHQAKTGSLTGSAANRQIPGLDQGKWGRRVGVALAIVALAMLVGVGLSILVSTPTPVAKGMLPTGQAAGQQPDTGAAEDDTEVAAEPSAGPSAGSDASAAPSSDASAVPAAAGSSSSEVAPRPPIRSPRVVPTAAPSTRNKDWGI